MLVQNRGQPATVTSVGDEEAGDELTGFVPVVAGSLTGMADDDVT